MVKAYIAYKNIGANLQLWLDTGLKEKNKAKEQMKKLAQRSMIAFMN